MFDTLFSYYSGNIYKSKCIGHVSLEYFIKAHKYPNKNTLDLLKKIKDAANNNDKELKNKLKEQLYSFTPSVFINKGNNRLYQNINNFTGFVQIDFDNFDNSNMANEFKHFIFNQYEFIVCSYLSPSSLGVKSIGFINTPNDVNEFKEYHNAIELELNNYDNYDAVTKNAVLPLFLSYDKDILVRQNPQKWGVKFEKIIDYVELKNEPKYKVNKNKNLFEKTVRIFKTKIGNINDNGHPQLRSSCLILGSRVSAGYIDYIDAVNLAEYCIINNTYLQKNIKGYIKTANWAIDEGMLNPKYYY